MAAHRRQIDYDRYPTATQLPQFAVHTDPVRLFNAQSSTLQYGTESFSNQQPLVQALFYSPENLRWVSAQLRYAGYLPPDDLTLRTYMQRVYALHPPFGEHVRFETDYAIPPGQYAQRYLSRLNRLLIKDLMTEYASEMHSRKAYYTDLCYNRGIDIPNPQYSRRGYDYRKHMAYDQIGWGRCF